MTALLYLGGYLGIGLMFAVVMASASKRRAVDKEWVVVAALLTIILMWPLIVLTGIATVIAKLHRRPRAVERGKNGGIVQ